MRKKKTFLLALCPRGNDYPGWFRLSQTFDWAQLGVEPVEAWKPAVVWNCCPTAHCYISSDVIAYSYQQYQWDLHSPLHEIKQYNTDRSFVKCALCYQKNCKKRPKINYEKNKALFASIATKKYKKINSYNLKSRQGTLCIFYGSNIKIKLNSNNNNNKHLAAAYS